MKIEFGDGRIEICDEISASQKCVGLNPSLTPIYQNNSFQTVQTPCLTKDTDLNNDGLVNVIDISRYFYLSSHNINTSEIDFNCDGQTNQDDRQILWDAFTK